MKKALSAIILILAVGCGTEAPWDAQIAGPTDQDVTLYGGGAIIDYPFTGPLVFQLSNADGDKPLPGVDIEFYSDGELTDGNGNPIGSVLGTGVAYYKTKTNDQGVAALFVQDDFPACVAGEDLTYTTTVDAVAQGATATWTGSVTIPQC